MKLQLAIILCLIFSLSSISAKSDPFSKVIITSNRATCKKGLAMPHTLIFNYLDNVSVIFADQSTVKADRLEILFETNAPKKQPLLSSPNAILSKNFAQHFKKIEFHNNVRIKNNQHSIKADKGLFNIIDNTCLLEGNVTIEQAKVKKSDIPVTVQSNRATFNLTTMETTLEGSNTQPVHTCFILENSDLKNKHSHSPRQGHQAS